MSQNFVRAVSLPTELEVRIESVLQSEFGLKLSDSKKLAAAVQKMSDYYLADAFALTPWNEDWCQIAQLVYYFPLNFLRSQTALKEAQRFQFLNGISSHLDFGSGLGPLSAALHQLVPTLQSLVIERSGQAFELSQKLGVSSQRLEKVPPLDEKTLLTFSYSLTEQKKNPEWIFKASHLLILEPSTREDGRTLLQLRQKLIDEGYSIWAPCPHQEQCPLLVRSLSDWCHDRVHFQRPEWWEQMESHLPFENRTLTFSYLVASKRPSPLQPNLVRIVGDSLKEKGKTRQLICQNSERKFFAWLNRQGEAPELPRGELVMFPELYQEVSNEVRPQSPVTSAT